MSYDNTNRFSAFKNKKEKDTQADLTGELDIEGKKYWFNAWTKKDKNGNLYISGSVRPKDSAKNVSAKEKTDQVYKPSVPEDFDSEIPFDKVRILA